MRKIFLRLLVPGIVALCVAPLRRAAGEYWELGWGGYTVGGQRNRLEMVRWDWVGIMHGSVGVQESISAANEALKHNPDQKYLVRLWPINHLGKFKENSFTGTFLDYHFRPEVRAKVRERIRDEVEAVLNGIAKPENVLGFTFLEELPGHWAECIRWRQMRVDLEHFGPQIAKEMGKKEFQWNPETRKYVTDIYVQTLREIYSYIKSLAPGRTVFHWQHTNVSTLDRLPPKDPMSDNFVLHNLSDVIGPGGADGLFTYANSKQIWDDYMRLVREHKWPFFSQLSHPSSMHLAPWQEIEELSQTRDPLNWGTFFYCAGHCKKYPSRDDPAIPEGRDRGSVDIPVHQRIFQNRHKIGLDALLSYLRPRLLIHAPLSELKSKGRAPLSVFVRNPRDIEFWPSYLQDDQTMHEVSITVDAPGGIGVKRTAGQADTIAPGAYERYDFLLTGGDIGLPLSEPVRIRVACRKSPPAVAEVRKEAFIPRFQVHGVRGAEESWMEPGLRLSHAMTPQITIRPLVKVIPKPSVTIDGRTITYEGEVEIGKKLTIYPNGRAELSAANLIAGFNEALKDKDSPTGYRIFDDGYVISGFVPNIPLESGKEYVLELEGMATGGANSAVGLRFYGDFEKDYHIDKRHKLVTCLWNGFNEKWSKVSYTFTLPEGAEGLERMYIYRYHSKGAISYGNFSLTPAGKPRDVTASVKGEMPLLDPDRLNHVTYRDEAGDRTAPKVEVRISSPER